MKNLKSLIEAKTLNKEQQRNVNGGAMFYYCEGRLQPVPCKADDSDNGDNGNQ
ncbi:hypothetical protein [Aquimarina sediminis]|uniref:hypothetical protein n=1 Tax=Aquimarina sediminis TaxID=2070536 RepID=UPI0013E8F324|nr:hypothetical protein [Aquimarina sediminis]